MRTLSRVELYKNPDNVNSETTDKDEEKAEILSQFFSSVFTKEPVGLSPQLQPRTILHIMQKLEITEDDIEKKLKKLKPNKSPGLDNLNPTFLKKYSTKYIETSPDYI